MGPTNLFVQVEMCQGQFNGFPNLLFLHVQATYVRICDVRLFICTKHCNRRVSFRRENVNEGIGVTVQGDGRRGFELFAVKGGKYSDNVVGTSGRLNNASA